MLVLDARNHPEPSGLFQSYVEAHCPREQGDNRVLVFAHGSIHTLILFLGALIVGAANASVPAA
jgi:acyl-CoA synthetase (AMP-forming)/AMP-acid ligase II